MLRGQANRGRQTPRGVRGEPGPAPGRCRKSQGQVQSGGWELRAVSPCQSMGSRAWPCTMRRTLGTRGARPWWASWFQCRSQSLSSRSSSSRKFPHPSPMAHLPETSPQNNPSLGGGVPLSWNAQMEEQRQLHHDLTVMHDLQWHLLSSEPQPHPLCSCYGPCAPFP